jgi:hypothetical protein
MFRDFGIQWRQEDEQGSRLLGIRVLSGHDREVTVEGPAGKLGARLGRGPFSGRLPAG